MNKDEALKMAIDDLELCNGAETVEGIIIYTHETIQACKEALEQPAQDAEQFFEHGKKIAKWADGQNKQPAQEPVTLLEALSDLEHQQWMKWAQSIIDSEPISEARKQRWATMMVDYKDLPDNIQEYDREWARKVLAITHPAPSWQGLSDDEMEKIHSKWMEWENTMDFARAIEQALKEKNI